MDFTDKRVLITGSSRGIGFDIAKTFIDAGARVAINGRTTQSVSVAIERLGDGERLVSAPGDIGTVAGCEVRHNLHCASPMAISSTSPRMPA